jgi:ATP/maltotriose-dependent transcriptional regulator MalT
MLASRARWHAALADWLRGDLPRAELGLAAAIAAWRDAGEHGLAAASCHLLGQVQRAGGRLDAALGTYQQAVEIAALPGPPVLPVAGIGHVGVASVAYERGDLDVAAREVTDGIVLCRQVRYHPPLAAGLVTLARIRQARGDPAGALHAIGEAGQIAPGGSINSLLNPIPAERARLALAQGDMPAAERWAAGSGLSAEDEPRYPQEPGHLVLARVLVSQGRQLEALALVDRLHAAAIAQGRAGSAIEAGALRALALAGAGQEPAAVGALAGALAAGCPQGYTRVFADEGPPMAALFGRLIAAGRSGHRAATEVPLGCLARLQRAFGHGHPTAGAGRRPGQLPGLVEALTRREAEVLALLATGRSNLDIAGELVVTLDTVKKHVGHIMAKLGAANRTEAVARARQLGLIPDQNIPPAQSTFG